MVSGTVGSEGSEMSLGFFSFAQFLSPASFWFLASFTSCWCVSFLWWQIWQAIALTYTSTACCSSGKKIRVFTSPCETGFVWIVCLLMWPINGQVKGCCDWLGQCHVSIPSPGSWGSGSSSLLGSPDEKGGSRTQRERVGEGDIWEQRKTKQNRNKTVPMATKPYVLDYHE